jgi:hypothetical protein
MSDTPPLVAIIMGSKSDWDTMRQAAEILTKFGIAHEARVMSAHRTPSDTAAYASNAITNGLEVIIAGAGGAAHLAGVIAAHTVLPVIGVPVTSALNGLDSLLSTVNAQRHSRQPWLSGRRAPPMRGCSPSRFWPPRGPIFGKSCTPTGPSSRNRCASSRSRNGALLATGTGMRRALACSALLAVALASDMPIGAQADEPGLPLVLQRFLETLDDGPSSYRAFRRLEVRSGRLSDTAWMNVWTTADTSGFTYEIVDQELGHARPRLPASARD